MLIQQVTLWNHYTKQVIHISSTKLVTEFQNKVNNLTDDAIIWKEMEKWILQRQHILRGVWQPRSGTNVSLVPDSKCNSLMISTILFFHSQLISFFLPHSIYSNNIYPSVRASITNHFCFPHSQRLIFLRFVKNWKPLNIDGKEKRQIGQIDPWHLPTQSPLSSYFSGKKFFSSFPKLFYLDSKRYFPTFAWVVSNHFFFIGS